VTRILMR